MLVVLNEDRVLYVPLVKRTNPKDLEGKKPDEIQALISPVGALTLLPGVNDVKDEEWALAKPDLLLWFKKPADHKEHKGKKALVELWYDVRGKHCSVFRDLPPLTCRKLLENTHNPATLQLWERTEVRESVRVDIKRRMEELKVEPAKGGDLMEDEDDEVQEIEAPSTNKNQPQKAPAVASKNQPQK
jgi:hypothetical protein